MTFRCHYLVQSCSAHFSFEAFWQGTWHSYLFYILPLWNVVSLKMSSDTQPHTKPGFVTHWGRNKMAAILRTTFWNPFTWICIIIFDWFRNQGQLFQRVLLQWVGIGPGNGSKQMRWYIINLTKGEQRHPGMYGHTTSRYQICHVLLNDVSLQISCVQSIPYNQHAPHCTLVCLLILLTLTDLSTHILQGYVIGNRTIAVPVKLPETHWKIDYYIRIHIKWFKRNVS